MTDAWYYAAKSKPVGPISIDELKRILGQTKDWRERLVWNASFNEWRAAGAVPELKIAVPPPIPKLPKKRRWWWWLSILVLIVGATYYAIVGGVTKDLLGLWRRISVSDVEAALSKVAEELKATTPKKIDADTTLIDCWSNGKQLTYVYQLNTVVTNPPPSMMAELRKAIVEKVCASNMKVGMISYHVTYQYLYKTLGNKDFGQFTISASDCV